MVKSGSGLFDHPDLVLAVPKTVVLNLFWQITLFDVFENLIALKTVKKSVQKIYQKIMSKNLS